MSDRGQEVLAPEDIAREAKERKELGLERRAQERHTLRMEWYRGAGGRQALNMAFVIVAFVGIVVAAKMVPSQDLWIIAFAALAAGLLLVIMTAFSTVAAQPPEER